eukprot:scaffold534797_cov38-Prasinocladus_malaysianus.AAC.1
MQWCNNGIARNYWRHCEYNPASRPLRSWWIIMRGNIMHTLELKSHGHHIQFILLPVCDGCRAD